MNAPRTADEGIDALSRAFAVIEESQKIAREALAQRNALRAENLALKGDLKRLREALEGLIANAPPVRKIREQYSYAVYLQAARTALAGKE